MKKPKHAKGYQAIHNLGQFAHPPGKPKAETRTGPLTHQVGQMSPKMAGKKVPPGSVSKPKMRKVAMKNA